MTRDRSGTINRLKRVEGQVRGLQQMLADERYCIDILHQFQAVKAALNRAEGELLKMHAAHCVAAAIASGDETDQHAKFDELIDLFEKARR